jgi:hypothetical protein
MRIAGPRYALRASQAERTVALLSLGVSLLDGPIECPPG